MIGKKLSHYTVIAKLGEGGMGEVYRAEDTKLGRQVAIKVLPAEMASSQERLERFQREAKALAALDHPGIVTVYSVEESDDVHFLTMQLVEGEPLDRLIPENGLGADRILEIGTAIAEALAAAHEKGIVHRDLKPSNIMIAGDGRVKVLDFGLAKFAAPQSGQLLSSEVATELHTRAGVVMGTVPYMSPEQVSGRAVDETTDIFSLGVVLYEMATGERPFDGPSSAELVSSILRDTPRPLVELRTDLPEPLAQVIGRCLEKGTADRIPSALALREALAAVGSAPPSIQMEAAPSSRAVSPAISVTAPTDEGFWVAVLPFKFTGANDEVAALAEGLSEEIVTGLSRFSYLQVIARSSSSAYADSAGDVRSIGREIGARYVMEGSLRQAGGQLRVAVQLVDASTGAHLWAETYDRPFEPDQIFAIQDDLVPRVVSTCADHFGVLARAISEAVRGRPIAELTPYEALMRGFGYHSRLTPEEHAEARDLLERAVEQAPNNADCWAMLSWVYSHEYAHEFNPRPGSLDRALTAARRAVDIAPSNHLAQQVLAVALFFRKETAGCLSAAERSMELNPLDGSNEAIFLIAFSGDWERGCALIRRSMELNPHHPGWFRSVLSLDEYRRADYGAAVDEAVKANVPDLFWTQFILAAAHGQLGDLNAAHKALADLLDLKSDFAESGEEFLTKWFEPQMVEPLMEGLRKAGLEGSVAAPSTGTSAGAESPETPSIAVLPFVNMSADKENQYFSDGLAEEIINALTRLPGLRVIARTSAFRFRDEQDLQKVGEALGVRTLLEGSVRRSGKQLRITAQLTDIEDQSHLWSERFDRELDDVFAIQDEISAAIVEKLHLSLGAAGTATREKTNLAAFEALLEGRYYFSQFTPKAAERALASLQRALSLEPDYPDALVLHAFYHVMLAYMFADPREELPQTKALVERALKLDPQHGEAQATMALVAVWMDRDWAGGERLFRRSLELAPASARIHELYGLLCLLPTSRLAEALAELDRAIELDPLSALYAGNRGRVLTCSRRFAEAEESCLRGLDLDPGQLLVQIELIYALTFQRKFAEAQAIGRRAIETHGYGKAPLHALAVSLSVAGEREEVWQLLDDAENAGGGLYHSPLTRGLVHAAFSEMDEAFRHVGEAIEQRDPMLWYLAVHPMFDSLRDDPRYPDLLQRMNLTASS